MSALTDEVLAEVKASSLPKLQAVGKTMVNRFLAGLEGQYEAAKSGRLRELLNLSLAMRIHALTAKNDEERALYEDGYKTAVMRLETVSLAEAIVAQEFAAASMRAGWAAALEALREIGQELLSVAIQAAVNGAAGSLAGKLGTMGGRA